jgi:hypothetical protein
MIEDDNQQLDFKAKSESEVLKVPGCAYANDLKSAVFFFCQCSTEDFFPICAACAELCHKKHNPALRLEGSYICHCGKTNHVVTKENERRIIEKKGRQLNQCFFSKFMDVTPNRGYFKYENTILCPVCVQYCHVKQFTDVSPVDRDDVFCQCEKHYDLNVINLNVDLISKPFFHKHFQNVNYNILSRIPFSRELYIDYIVEKINDFHKNPTTENSQAFFSNFINYKTLELFSTFAVRWENKFFHVKNYLNNVPSDILINLLCFNEKFHINNVNEITDYTTSKFYFAEYLFNYFLRTFMLSNNNLLNVKTIINMNLYQRFIYIQEIQNFYKFKDPGIERNYDKVFPEFTNTVLELYETILKVNESFDFTEKIVSYIFPTFNRIMKYLIKYNLINDDLKLKYFELVLDTINLANENGIENLGNSVFYVIKSILYCLIYRNDRLCLNYLRKSKDKHNKIFVFESNPESDNMCKIFVSIISKYDRTEDRNRTIIYDFYIQKIFDLTIGKKEFYLKNLKNMRYLQVEQLEYLVSPNNAHASIRRGLEKYFIDIIRFCESINKYNRDYFNYELKYLDYLDKVNDVLEELRTFILNDINFLPDMTKNNYLIYDKSNISAQVIEKILNLQNCTKYTQFFQKIEEFLHIYSEGRTFKRNKMFDQDLQIEHLKVILQFLLLLVYKDYENMSFLMNIKVNIFINTFFDIKELLFNFLAIVCVSLFSDNVCYKFDNYNFFSECIMAIVEKAVFTDSNNMSQNLASLEILSKAMNLCHRPMRMISLMNNDILDAIETIIYKLKEINKNKTVHNLVVEYFLKDNQMQTTKRQENRRLEEFINSYFFFLNELIANDLYSMDIFKEADHLFTSSQVELIINKLFEYPAVYKYNIPMKIEYEITNYYINKEIYFNFNVQDIRKQLMNIFNKNDNISNVHLLHLTRDEWISDIEKLISKVEKLFKFWRKFEENIISISENTTGMDRALLLINYFEEIVVKPSYFINNFFMMNAANIKSKESFMYFEFVFNFLKITYIYYDLLSKHDFFRIVPNIIMENIFFEFVSLKYDISDMVKRELYDDTILFTKGGIKYFDYELIYSTYIKNLQRILRVKKDNLQFKKTNTFLREPKIVDNSNTIQLSKLIAKFEKKVETIFDDKLSLIKILDSTDNSNDIDPGFFLYDYLTMKFSDDLGLRNMETYNNYHIKNISHLTYDKFKFQNIYTLFYLNALFYHDSGRFQEILKDNMQDETFNNFFSLITTKIIFPGVLLSAKKAYQLDSFICNNRMRTDITTLAIKFLQNLCESHNIEFQSLFFDFTYNEYITNRSEAEETSPTHSPRKTIKDREAKELQFLKFKKYSFLNFVCHNMRLLMELLNFNYISFFESNRELKNYDDIGAIYQRFSDLVIEMIQGTTAINFDNFYKKLPSTLHIINDETGEILNPEVLESFIFVKKCLEIKKLLANTHDQLSLPMKINMFTTINNLISQELGDLSMVKLFATIFPAEELLNLISLYVRTLYIKYISKLDLNNPKFLTKLNSFEFSEKRHTSLIEKFNSDNDMFEDDVFKLCSQMYLFLTILAEKYKYTEVAKALSINEKELIITEKIKRKPTEDNKDVREGAVKNISSTVRGLANVTFIETHRTVLTEEVIEPKIIVGKASSINNSIISARFFKNITKSCEFMIATSSSDEQGQDLKLKKIYFILDPRVHLISQSNIDEFFDTVDRSSSSTKLKSMIDKLNFFLSEVEFKYEHLQKNYGLKKMFEIDYKDADLYNFLFSLFINLTLLATLTSNEMGLFTSIIVHTLTVAQICMNLLYLYKFYVSKYRFEVIVGKRKLGKGLSLPQLIRLNVFDSFLFNDEISLLILNNIIALIALFSKYGIFLYSIQLLTIVKFVSTIKEIVIAFKLRFIQLVSMIGFLLILIFFYSNIGFFFLYSEFEVDSDKGNQINICNTLLECVITYFNEGVRSSGGIGDILTMKSYESKSYWMRWTTDMVFYITVSLLLLNMVNGVIVSTFSQIREENQEKEEDIKNKCYICNINRVEFEKRKVSFDYHQKVEHNSLIYIKFLIHLKLISPKDLDADQSFIIGCLLKRDVCCFPVKRSMSIGSIDDEEEDTKQD